MPVGNEVIQIKRNDGHLTLESDDKEYLRNALANSHVNFLLGAGFSKNAGLSLLGNREKWQEWGSHYSWGESKLADMFAAALELEYFKNLLLPMADLEVITPVKEMVSRIRWIIEKRGTVTLPKRANIFTTNYDPIIEMALEQSECSYNDGFEGRDKPSFRTAAFSKLPHSQSLAMEYSSAIPTLNLIKLHGSINWKRDGENCICYEPHQSGIDLIKTEFENLISAEWLDDLRNVVESDVGSDSISEMIALISTIPEDDVDLLSKFSSAYANEFCLINPTKGKFNETVMDLTYYELLRIFANELDRNNALLMSFGFSFADEHICEITKRALGNPRLILLLFCHKEEDIDGYKEKFGASNNVIYIACNEGVFELDEMNEVLDLVIDHG